MWVCLELKLVHVKRQNKRSSGLRPEESGVDKINSEDVGDDIKRNKAFRRVSSIRSFRSSSRACDPCSGDPVSNVCGLKLTILSTGL